MYLKLLRSLRDVDFVLKNVFHFLNTLRWVKMALRIDLTIECDMVMLMDK